MARALMLVQCTPLSIAEIRTRVGMADRSHFARDFRRAHGFSPRTTRIHVQLSTTHKDAAVHDEIRRMAPELHLKIA
jgi:transcriptional regulator GlxA family with amidase domain